MGEHRGGTSHATSTDHPGPARGGDHRHGHRRAGGRRFSRRRGRSFDLPWFHRRCRARLEDNCFDGVGHVVPPGTALTVRNSGQLPHTYTAVDGSFDTGRLQPGESAELTDLAPGAWPVRCTLHSSVDGGGMTGMLVVADNPGLELAAATSDATSSGGNLGWWLLAVAASTGAGAVLARRLTRATP